MRKLTVKNFSVIKDAELEFGKITVLIGPQSSGKSLLCKLAYFLRYELVGAAVDAAVSGQTWEGFQDLACTRFRGWFPPEAWATEKFQIQLQLDRYSIEIVGPKPGSGNQLLSLNSSDDFKEIYLKLMRPVGTPNLRSTPELAQIAAWDEFMHLQDSSHMTSAHFIPAGRASFTNNLGSAVMQAATLEPLIRRFASEVIWNPVKWMPGLLVSGRNEPDSIKATMEEIVGGTVVIRENEPAFFTSKNRTLPLSLLSSGTQELLPLFNVLNRLVYTHEHTAAYFRMLHNGEISKQSVPVKPFVYLEEPEAHLFPSTQYELIKLFVWLANDSILSFEWVITTHSPYILSAFGNLIKAGQAAKARPERAKEIDEKIIPKRYWIEEGDFKAYAIDGKTGTLKAIMDKETGLINGDYLDDVSSDIAEEFGKLLEIQYGGK